MLTIQQINDLSEKTSDAYAYDRYGEGAWMHSIVNLSAIGYTLEQIEWILYSKYMRWAADRFGTWAAGEDKSNPSVTLNGTEIIQYHGIHGIEIKDD